MIVDQAIAGRPEGASIVDARKAVDDHLVDLGERIRLEELTAPKLRFGPQADADAEAAPVVPIRKRDALRATWGLEAARQMGDQ